VSRACKIMKKFSEQLRKRSEKLLSEAKGVEAQVTARKMMLAIAAYVLNEVSEVAASVAEEKTRKKKKRKKRKRRKKK